MEKLQFYSEYIYKDGIYSMSLKIPSINLDLCVNDTHLLQPFHLNQKSEIRPGLYHLTYIHNPKKDRQIKNSFTKKHDAVNSDVKILNLSDYCRTFIFYRDICEEHYEDLSDLLTPVSKWIVWPANDKKVMNFKNQ